MASIKALFLAALFSCLVPYAHGCAVDGVASKTDTTLVISWNVSKCKKLSAGDTFEVCWKEKGDWNFPCGANKKTGQGESGTITIPGLSPGQTYKVRTKWHHRSTGWHLVTNRTVTMDRTSQSSSDTLLLRYEKQSGKPYCVNFYFKHANPSSAVIALSDLSLHVQHKSFGSFGIWVSAPNQDLKTAVPNPATKEYVKKDLCSFLESTGYRAQIYKGSDPISNKIEWK